MTKSKFFYELFHWAVLAAIVAVAMPDLAVAQVSGTDVGSLTKSFATQELSPVPTIIGALSYTIGAFLLVSGALKLKAHAESPNEKLAPGIARLLTGGAIISLPTLANVIKSSTIGTAGTAVTYTSFNATF